MSTKIAVCIGDYSNGWSDSWIVQLPAEGLLQSKIANDKDAVLKKMTLAVQDLVDFVLSNERINPKPKDKPCCEKFAEWFKTNQESKFCSICGTRVTEERAKAHKKVNF